MLAACLAGASSCNERPARPADPKTDKLKLPDGFIAEHLFSPSDSGRGSWVAMTFDDKGRLIVSDQFGALYRLKLPPIGADSTQQVSIEPLGFGKDTIPGTDSVRTKVTMGFAQGLLYAFNSLYVMVNHSANDQFDKGSGLYRLQDTDNDDQFDKVTLLKAMEGSGEHGPHSIILSPDGQSIYLIAGNHTKCPEMDAYMLPSNWQEDNLIPRMVDPNGHAVNIKPPADGSPKSIRKANTGNWSAPATAIRSTLRSTTPAICSLTIQIWSGISGCPGTVPQGSAMPPVEAISVGGRVP
ncbi:hypothetical protein [Chitinophaga caseinilytica]|uniref:hypothetical protein n=1 Tax=Chitinophaga caseinilytica TaxID=2267521 RepID=UPI003D6A83E3